MKNMVSGTNERKNRVTTKIAPGTVDTPEYIDKVTKSIGQWGEHWMYLLENPSDLDIIDGAAVTFDENDFERLKRDNPGGKIVLIKKTYQYIVADLGAEDPEGKKRWEEDGRRWKKEARKITRENARSRTGVRGWTEVASG